MHHALRLATVSLLLVCAVPAHASVASLADEVADLLLRGRRAVTADALQARSLAGEVESAAGPRGLRLVKAADAAGIPAVEAAQCLIRHPCLAEHGLDGLRTARQIGGGPATHLAANAPESLVTAAQDQRTAQRWYRLVDHPEAARLTPADRQAIAARVAREPDILDRILRNVPALGLGAALMAAGIGVSIAAANAPLAIGGAVGGGILLVAAVVACWCWWRWVVPARRRAVSAAGILLLIAGGSPLCAESAEALLIRLEQADRTAVLALADGFGVEVDARADVRAARSAAGAPSEMLRAEPEHHAADALRRLALAWARRTSELDDGIRSRHQELLLALPYGIADRLPCLSDPLPPVNDSPALPSDRTLAHGNRLRLAATIVALPSPLYWPVDLALGATADEAIARSIATPLSEARIAAAEMAGGRTPAAFRAIHARRLALWHDLRRARLRAALADYAGDP